MFRKQLLAIMIFTFLFVNFSFADSNSLEDIKNSNIIKAIQKSAPDLGGFKLIDFGDEKYLYASNDSSAFFISKDGEEVVPGNILRSSDGSVIYTLHERYEAFIFQDFIGSVPNDYFVTYGLGDNTLYALIDYTCPYCKRFHRDINKFVEKGYSIKLLPLSRVSNNVSVIEGLMKIWCSEGDRKLILDAAYNNKSSLTEVSSTCSTEYFNTSKRVSDFAKDYGVQGTPAIFTESGRYLGGYSSFEALLNKIDGE